MTLATNLYENWAQRIATETAISSLYYAFHALNEEEILLLQFVKKCWF